MISNPTDLRATVLAHRPLGRDLRLLRLLAPAIARRCEPGQFVMVRCGDAPEPLLRRPLSVQRVDGDQLDLLYRIVGQGTAALAAVTAGGEIDLLGPLGRGFTLPEPGQPAVLIGGGVGVPPLVALADRLCQRDGEGARWTAFLGARDKTDRGCFVGFDERFAGCHPAEGRVHRATDDGSLGFAGHAVGAWIDHLDRHGAPSPDTRVYACGPMVMLHAVAAEAAARSLACEVSVETTMGCGTGLCMGCAIENTTAGGSAYDRWVLACTHGPVFDATTISLSSAGGAH